MEVLFEDIVAHDMFNAADAFAIYQMYLFIGGLPQYGNVRDCLLGLVSVNLPNYSLWERAILCSSFDRLGLSDDSELIRQFEESLMSYPNIRNQPFGPAQQVERVNTLKDKQFFICINFNKLCIIKRRAEVLDKLDVQENLSLTDISSALSTKSPRYKGAIPGLVEIRQRRLSVEEHFKPFSPCSSLFCYQQHTEHEKEARGKATKHSEQTHGLPGKTYADVLRQSKSRRARM